MADRAPSLSWHAPRPDPRVARRIGGQLGLHPLMGQLLLNRGITDVAAARDFLQPGRPASLSWRLPGVKAAAWRMLQAVHRKEDIVVYGDYDADGQTSTAILVRALRRLGATVRPFIPHRLSQGYGLHEDVLVEMAGRGVRLVVAVDCGLTALKAVREAGRRGLDVVVVDHHEPGPRLPPAAAVVAAHRMVALPGGESMAAAGLAYHTARALLEFANRPDDGEDDALLQLAAIGTVADVASLTGENRRLVREGLERIRTRPVAGLAALARRAGVEPAEVDTFHVAFILAPRLNAAGRVDDPAVGLSLLLADSPEQAQELAERLEAANRTRQEMERRVLEEALADAERQLEAGDRPVIVTAGESWHPGVIGVVASRLVERFARPAVVIAIEGEEARGSARSVPEVNLYEAMLSCSEYFTKFGGHPMAAGFSMAASDVLAFRERLTEAVAARWNGPFVARLELDAWVRLADVGPELAHQLSLLEPHGDGNPRPVLGAAGLELVEARPVGQDGRHLRLVVREPQTATEAGVIAFGRAEQWKDLVDGATAGRRLLDLAFTPRLGRFGEVELRAVALREAGAEVARFIWELDGAPALLAKAPEPAAQDVAQQAWEHAAPGEAMSAGAVVVEDRRGLADAAARALAEWMASRDAEASMDGARPVQTVVVVRDALAAVRLCGAVWRTIPELAGRVAWAGEGDEVPPASDLFGEPARVLVTWEPSVLSRAGSPVDVLLWEVPSEPWRWAAVWRRTPVRRVVLAYGEEDRRLLERRYLAPLPDREALRHLYRLLTAQASVAGAHLPGDLHALAAALAVLDPRFRPRLSPELLAHALAVFEELGLVVRSSPRGEWVWKGAKAGVKLDLAQSARYNELIEARRFWQEALDGAFSGEATSWWRKWAPTSWDVTA